MNLGDRLFELRKSKKLTQDDVAEKLNVTRQTVSKWETNQSTPDFDKIVPLCDLYRISADELLKGEKQDNDTENNEKEDNEKFDWNEAKNHLFTREKDDEETKKQNNIVKQINKTIDLICLVIYLVISFSTMAWHITWIIFLINAIICQIVRLIFMLKEEKHEE